MVDPDLLPGLRRRTPDLLAALAALVGVETPSEDLEALRRGTDAVAELGRRLLGADPVELRTGGVPCLWWGFGAPRVLLLAHLDTVWPLGTTSRWPFAVHDGLATGPGAFDMKAGLVQGLFALAALPDRDGVGLLVTGDEEIGSPASRAVVEDRARGLEAVLVLEPSLDGALKTARKGVASYRLRVAGRAAHAGLEPERGANALVELAAQVLAVARLADPLRGTTVTPTVARAGTAVNVVPALAEAAVDVRVPDAAEQRRVTAAFAALRATTAGTRLTVEGGENRPPLDPSASAALFERARAVAGGLGLGPLAAARVGGGSDGNLTAGVGTPTLDGLGAVGAGAHAEGEHVVVAAMPERAALVAALAADLLVRPVQRPPASPGAART